MYGLANEICKKMLIQPKRKCNAVLGSTITVLTREYNIKELVSIGEVAKVMKYKAVGM